MKEPDSLFRRHLWWGLPLLVAVAMRLIFHVGFQCGDDMVYGQSASDILEGRFELEPHHMRLRFGMLAPIAASLALFGGSVFALTLWNLLCSLGIVATGAWLARRYGGDRAGLLTGLALAIVPASIYCGTEITPDTPAALAMVVAAALFLSGCEAQGRRAVWLGLAAGAVLGLGHLAKETAFFLLAFVALESLIRKRPRAAIGTALGFAIVLAVEMGVYAGVTGDPLYRVYAVRGSHVGTLDHFVSGSSAAWYAPLRSVVREHEWYGLHYLLFIVGAVVLARRGGVAGPFLRWWVVLFLLIGYWPAKLDPYQRALPPDPRYYDPLLVPSAVIIGLWLASLRRGIFWSLSTAALLLALSSNVLLQHNASIRAHIPRSTFEFLRRQGGSQRVVADSVTLDAVRFLSGYRPIHDVRRAPDPDWTAFHLVWNEGAMSYVKDLQGVDEAPPLRAILDASEHESVLNDSAPRSWSYKHLFQGDPGRKPGVGLIIYSCTR